MMSANTKLLRGLLAIATPRPWQATSRGNYGVDHEADVNGSDGKDLDGAEFTTPGNADTVRGQMREADARLIVAAVNALPGLLDELETLRAALAQLRAERDAARILLGWAQTHLAVGCEARQGYRSEHIRLATAIDAARKQEKDHE